MGFISSRVVTSRKPSICFGCSEVYPAGTRMKRIVGTADGKDDRKIIETTSYCPTCDRYWDEHMEWDDEIMSGDLKFNDQDGWNEIHAKLNRGAT